MKPTLTMIRLFVTASSVEANLIHSHSRTNKPSPKAKMPSMPMMMAKK